MCDEGHRTTCLRAFTIAVIDRAHVVAILNPTHYGVRRLFFCRPSRARERSSSLPALLKLLEAMFGRNP